MCNLISDFIQDLKIEAVKLNLQLCSPNAKRLKNDMLGTLVDGELNSVKVMEVVRAAIKDLQVAVTIIDIQRIFNRWNKQRIKVQYAGYYDSGNKGEAYAYVFLMRVLKKRHTDLFYYMKSSP